MFQAQMVGKDKNYQTGRLKLVHYHIRTPVHQVGSVHFDSLTSRWYWEVLVDVVVVDVAAAAAAAAVNIAGTDC